jgi:hypothetical protein
MNDKNSLYLYGITRNDKNIDQKKYVNVMHTGKKR